MTSQEQDLLNGLVQRVRNTQLQSKDQEAEQLLQSSLGGNPDALYILAQTVLVQQFALDSAQRQLAAARQQIEQMQQAAQQPSQLEHHGSFLGNLLGLNRDEPQQAIQQRPSAPPQQPQYAPVNAPPPAAGYSTGYASQPGYAPAPPTTGRGGLFGGGGGFLQGALQTAAGVAAGEMAFQGIEDLLHGGRGGGFGGFTGAFGGGQPTEVINNYYDDSGSGRDQGGFGDRLAAADNSGGGLSPDIDDRRNDGADFSGASGSGTDDAQSGFDQDDSNFADPSGNGEFDDGGTGSFDDGSGGGFDGGGGGFDDGSGGGF